MHSLVRRQLRKAFPAGGADAPELQAFIAAVSDAYTAADDDRRQLEHSLDLASQELVERNRTLEGQVEALTRLEQIVTRRTAELDRRNRDMALILDNVAQGFVTVELDGTLSGEGSRTLARWFGAPGPGARVWSYLLGHDPDLEAWMQLGFESLQGQLMPVEIVLAQLPSRIERGKRQLRVEYRAIGAPTSALLIVVSDITEEVARERSEAAQRELIALIERAARDRNGFFAFVRETNLQLARCADPTTSDAEFLRDLHTLKGNLALFGLPSLAELGHELESKLVGGCSPCARRGITPLLDAWDAVCAQLDTLLGGTGRRMIAVDWDEYQAVLAAIGETRTPWAVRLRRWGQDPTRPHLERFAAQARQLAERLGRAELEVDIDDQDLAVEADRFAPLWSALIHTVRNAVDHGIETADARIEAGKPERARLVLTTARRGEQIAIEITDDGAGVDWEAVARRAAALGLPASTAHDLHEALFADGVSTAAAVSTTSGRGVGLSALRAICVALGGDVELQSRRGRGTTVRCLLPLAQTNSLTRRLEVMRP
ncbi:MAG: Hpt domain-containing protein [Deltaproteobacteria bacterium]|nr:Hpt domain-containing protein [Deltaproteobacteria bacterium]